MFKNLPYKQKFFAIVVLFIVLGITAHKRSFSVAIDAYSNLESAKAELTEVSDSKLKINGVKTEVDYLDRIIGKEAANTDQVQQEILNTFNTMETRAELVNLEEVHSANNDYFNIYTNQLVLSGGFNDLLKATYHYERKFDFSRVVSLRLYVEKEPRTQRRKLFEKIIFQNYEKIR